MYLVLFIAGLVVDHDSSANFVPVNGAANWLVHTVRGVGYRLQESPTDAD